MQAGRIKQNIRFNDLIVGTKFTPKKIIDNGGIYVPGLQLFKHSRITINGYQFWLNPIGFNSFPEDFLLNPRSKDADFSLVEI